MAVLMVTWWAPQDKACERERESRAKSVVFSELVALPRRLYLQEGCFQEGATAPYNEFPCDESGSSVTAHCLWVLLLSSLLLLLLSMIISSTTTTIIISIIIIIVIINICIVPIIVLRTGTAWTLCSLPLFGQLREATEQKISAEAEASGARAERAPNCFNASKPPQPETLNP